MKKRLNPRDGMEHLWRAARAHAGELAYYAAVALALVLIAFAAEAHRRAPEGEADAPSLPAAELAAPAEEEAQEAQEEEAPLAPEGELLRIYSEAPIWSAELGLWESHPALDYRLEGEVTCLLSGTVRAVERGGALGGCVEVVSGARVLRYASIEPRDDLRPGDALEAGEAIGAAGESMPGEASMGPHLHLELIEGGRHADFAARAELSANGD